MDAEVVTLIAHLRAVAAETPVEEKHEKRATLLTRKRELLIQERATLRQSEHQVIASLKRVQWDRVEPVLVLAPPSAYATWVYLRMIASSAPYTGRPGRMIRLFCLDQRTHVPIGVIEVGSDLQSLKLRDDWIGWTHDEKYREGGLQRVANVSSCVPVAPFGLLCGGKYLADALVTDDQFSIARLWKQKYGETLGLLTITSLFGKSSMYNRLPRLTYLGTTMGLGVTQLSSSEYDLLKRFALHIGLTGRAKNRTFLTTSRNDLLDTVCAYLGVKREEISVRTPKGVYIAPVVANPVQVCRWNEQPDRIKRSRQDAQDYYRARWLAMRLKNDDIRSQVNAFDPETYRVDAQIELCRG